MASQLYSAFQPLTSTHFVILSEAKDLCNSPTAPKLLTIAEILRTAKCAVLTMTKCGYGFVTLLHVPALHFQAGLGCSQLAGAIGCRDLALLAR